MLLPVPVAFAVLLVLASLALPCPAATFVVTSNSDTVNGNTSSPAALAADPGPDGVSLREAVLTAHATPGPHTISFSPALSGQSIVLAGTFFITTEGIAIEGLLGTNGRPAVTLDAGAVTSMVFSVKASNFRLSRMRVYNLQSAAGVWLNAGSPGNPPTTAYSGLNLTGNEFSNEGLATARAFSTPVLTIGTDHQSIGAQVSDVTIADNSFTNFRQATPSISTVHLHVAGNGSVIERVLLRGNRFTDTDFAIELVPDGGSGNRISGVQILDNASTASIQAININIIGDSRTIANTIEDTLVAGNTLRGGQTGVFIIGGMNGDSGNTVRNTLVLNNRISGASGSGVIVTAGLGGGFSNTVDGFHLSGNILNQNNKAIWLAGGINASGTGNTLKNVRVANNLVVGNLYGTDITGGYDQSNNNLVTGLSFANNTYVLNSNFDASINANNSASGNRVAGVTLLNTLSDRSSSLPGAELVANSVVDGVGFVDAASGNYQLLSSSRAIDAGAAAGAPRIDLRCAPRTAAPDAGAYEYGGTGTSCTVFDRVFAWAEWEYPALFQQYLSSGTYESYRYRYYAGTGAYLASHSNGHVYYLGPDSGGNIVDLGPVLEWIGKALAAGF